MKPSIYCVNLANNIFFKVQATQPVTSVASSGSEVRIKLPPNWRTARDPGGRLYYYNRKTKEVAWDPPESTESSPNDVIANEKVMEVNQLQL